MVFHRTSFDFWNTCNAAVTAAVTAATASATAVTAATASATAAATAAAACQQDFLYFNLSFEFINLSMMENNSISFHTNHPTIQYHPVATDILHVEIFLLSIGMIFASLLQ